MIPRQMRIGGEWVDAGSGRTYAVVNPATEREIGQLPLGDGTDADKAVAAAQQALPIWSAKPVADRARILEGIAGSIDAHAEELAFLDILDHGTPRQLAHMLAQTTSRQVRYFAQLSRSLAGTVVPVEPSAQYSYHHEPIGVCALILPWNLPLMNTVLKISAALAAGNTCVVKPASVDSLVALKLGEIFDQGGLPPGAVNVVTGPGTTVGEALASHLHVGMVSLVGGCETGRRIMHCAAGTVKRLSLELGGKNPFIVLEDADIDAAIAKGVFASFFNSGMVCAAPGRYYVHERLYDAFLEGFVTEAKKIVVGDPMSDSTQMGPLVSDEHRQSVESYIETGKAEGAKLLLGGDRPSYPPLDKGYFVTPTIFADVTQQMTIAREEIFGPVACILRFSSSDDVVGLANDTRFGLCASVWTKDIPRALAFAGSLQAGTVWINDHMKQADELPWGGFRESGFGKDGSLLGLKEFTQVKQITIGLV
ncbi:MAG: aldehyde dehydrogenase [Armatimonadetes bacterium]|nr:aldehyde dehydrogenase [Armatimonadota bacterium]